MTLSLPRIGRYLASSYRVGASSARLTIVLAPRLTGLLVCAAILLSVFSAGCSAQAVPAPAAASLPSPPATAVQVAPAPSAQPMASSTPQALATTVPTSAPTSTGSASPEPALTSTGEASPTALPANIPAPTGVAVTAPVAQAPADSPIPAPTAVPPTASPVRPTATLVQSGATVATWPDRLGDQAGGQTANVSWLAQQGVRLSSTDGTFASSGEYVSPVMESKFAFDNAVATWNADLPPGTTVRLEIRVRDASGWSSWYAMGEWGPDGGKSISGQSDARGKVDVDTLKLTSPANALQYRAKLSTTSEAASPLLRQVSVTYADMKTWLTGPQLARVPGAVRDLDVPQRSQLEEDPSYRSEICSATSLAMLMQYWGLDRSVAQVVAGVRDRTARIYGNWALNMAYAGMNGFEARVERFYSMVQVEQQIAAGRPVAISIAFNPGELSASPIKSTDGHLIVVRGFTSDGSVIVNDPIASSAKSVRLIYNRDELTRIWLRSGGVAYVISPRAGGPLAR